MSRYADLHVYDAETMWCRACSEPWVCKGGRDRLTAEFANRESRHLRELLAETAAIAVQVLKPETQDDIDAIHDRIRGWVGAPRG